MYLEHLHNAYRRGLHFISSELRALDNTCKEVNPTCSVCVLYLWSTVAKWLINEQNNERVYFSISAQAAVCRECESCLIVELLRVMTELLLRPWLAYHSLCGKETGVPERERSPLCREKNDDARFQQQLLSAHLWQWLWGIIIPLLNFTQQNATRCFLSFWSRMIELQGHKKNKCIFFFWPLLVPSEPVLSSLDVGLNNKLDVCFQTDFFLSFFMSS